MRIAVTGTQGQVVVALAERGEAAGFTISPVGRPSLDLADIRSVRPALEAVDPHVIVSAAAYTAVDKAETERDIAWRINAAGAGAVAAAAREMRVPIVHLSTDYVFDGAKTEPWTEDDSVGPLGVYGASKLAGEYAVAAATPDHAILRVAWVVSPFGANFVKTMLRLAESRDALRVVSDQIGGPTSALDIADGVLAVCRNMTARSEDSELRGTFHMGSSGFGSWADLAESVFERLAAKGGKKITVERITTADYPTPARRPANSRLDSRLIAERHGVILPDWKQSVTAIVDRLLAPTN